VLQVDRDIWAVVADAPLDRFDGEALKNELHDIEAISRHALAHASIVEFFFHHAPVIPLKLFTLFSSDDAARADLQARAARLRRMFADLRGLEEWGVRIVAGEIEERAAAALSSGRDYLQTKKRLHHQTLAPPRTIVRAVNGALSSIGKLAARTKKEAFPPPGKGRPYVAGASYLVRTARRGEWKKKIVKTTIDLANQGHRLEVSGPWPPYHFVGR
jgi:hypothetical protein